MKKSFELKDSRVEYTKTESNMVTHTISVEYDLTTDTAVITRELLEELLKAAGFERR